MNKCFECETTEDLQEHHVVPKSRGGTKTVTLCYECHMKAHGRTGKGLNHSRLTKEALARSKKALGTHNPIIQEATRSANLKRGKNSRERMRPHLEAARAAGHTSLNQIAAYLNSKGITTPRGKQWVSGNVSRLLKQIKQNTEISKEDK